MPKIARLTLEKTIKKALNNIGKSVNSLAKESGVSQPILQRFLSGQRGLTLETAEKLCVFLDLELKPKLPEKTPESR